MEDGKIIENSICDNADLKDNQPKNCNVKKLKEKVCEIINYNKNTKILDIRFNRYGIRLYDVENFNGDTITIKYKGEIGKPNFKIETIGI